MALLSIVLFVGAVMLFILSKGKDKE